MVRRKGFGRHERGCEQKETPVMAEHKRINAQIDLWKGLLENGDMKVAARVKTEKDAFFRAMRDNAPGEYLLFQHHAQELENEIPRIVVEGKTGGVLACAILASSLMLLPACAMHAQQNRPPETPAAVLPAATAKNEAEKMNVEKAAAPESPIAESAGVATKNQAASPSREELEAAYQNASKGLDAPPILVENVDDARTHSKNGFFEMCNGFKEHKDAFQKQYGSDFDFGGVENEAKTYCAGGYRDWLAKDRRIDSAQADDEKLLETAKKMLTAEGTLPQELKEKLERHPPVITAETPQFFMSFYGKLLGLMAPASNHLLMPHLEHLGENMKIHIVLHETLHYVSLLGGGGPAAVRWRGNDGAPVIKGSETTYFTEANNELQTQKILLNNGIRAGFYGYSQDFSAMCVIEGIVGENVLKAAAFTGEYTEVMKKLDATLGKGSFERIALKNTLGGVLEEISHIMVGANDDETGLMLLLFPAFTNTLQGPFGIGKKELETAKEAADWLITKKKEDENAAKLAATLIFLRATGAVFKGTALSTGITEEAYAEAKRLTKKYGASEDLLKRAVEILSAMATSEKTNGALWSKSIVNEALSIATWEAAQRAKNKRTDALMHSFMKQFLGGMDPHGSFSFIKNNVGGPLEKMDEKQAERYVLLCTNIFENPKFRAGPEGASALSVAAYAIRSSIEEDWVFLEAAGNPALAPEKIFNKKTVGEIEKIAKLANALEKESPGVVEKVKWALNNPKLKEKDFERIINALSGCSANEAISNLEELDYWIN